jgi:hypothetical protein
MNRMPQFRKRQQGAVAIIVGLSIVILVGMLALVIDLGHLYIAKTELQNAADAAALAGAKELVGTADGVTAARDKAKEFASANNYDFSKPVVITDGDISFGASPTGPWDDGADPSNKFFIKVDTRDNPNLGDLDTWFAPVLGLISGNNFDKTRTFGMAVAGRFPPNALAPLFVPAVRRNSDQATGPDEFPYCKGVIYDPGDKNFKNKKKCPYDPPNKGLVNYRVPDDTGNWGFLTPQETKTFTDLPGIPDCPLFSPSGDCAPENPGSYYVITPTPNNEAGTPWVSGTSWTGNFGFLLRSDDVKTLNELAAALCRGGTVTSYPVPGCGEVKTGNLSGPKIGANINTRFDLQSNQTQLPHSACPSDTNIYDPGSSNWNTPGYYAGYSAGSPLVSPSNFPPGEPNRRLINVYVADNVVLPGENLPGNHDDTCWADELTGVKNEAHLVGCAQFFIWTKASNDGKLYAEFVKKLGPGECGPSPLASFTGIRLYQ